MERIIVWVIGILVALCIVVAGVVFVLSPAGTGKVVVRSGEEAGCLASRGTVSAGTCCLSSKDFPDSCLVGACGCSAENSHAVKTCSCPPGECFNGTACVLPVQSFAECVAGGYPVTESYPRQCRVPGGPSFVESVPPTLTAGSCSAARGHWNGCGSRCQIDNQGVSTVACPALCEQLCECGGFAGFGCPKGYLCKMPSGVADALGYCVPG